MCYEQTDGISTGYPLMLEVTNFYMETSEKAVLQPALLNPNIGFDTWTIFSLSGAKRRRSFCVFLEVVLSNFVEKVNLYFQNVLKNIFLS